MRLTSSSIFMLGLLASMSAAQADPISLNIPAATMGSIVKELSDKTGETYEVLPSLAGEVLHLSFKDLEPDVVRNQIASILRANWKGTAKGWRLVPNDQAWRDLRGSQLAKDIETLKKFMSDRAKEMPENLSPADLERLEEMQKGIREGRPPMGDWAAGMRAMNGLVPGNRAAFRCMQALDLTKVASMGAGTRKVFSLSPTQMQSVLGNSAKQAATAALDEYAMFETNTPRTDRTEQTTMVMGGGIGFSSPTRLSAQGPVTNVIVAVNRPQEGLAFNVTVTAYNAQNQVVFSGTEFLGEGGGGFRVMGGPAQPASSSGAPNGKIKFSEDAILAMQAMRRSRSGDGVGFASMQFSAGGGRPIELGMPFLDGNSGALKVSDALRAKLARPDLYDPLSTHVAESITHLVGDPAKPVIALLPDALTQQISNCVSETSSQEAIQKDWENAGMIQTTVEGWVVFEPKRIVDCVDTRVNRPQLAKALADLSKTGIWRLDAKATYFAARPRMTPTNFDLAIIGSLYPNSNMIPTPAGANRDFLRLWGMLSVAERRTLLGGGELPLKSFTTETRNIIANIVFDSAGGPARPAGEARGGFAERPNPGLGTLDVERTSVLGTGLPALGVLRLKTDVEPAALGRYDTGAVRALGAGSIFTSKMQFSPNSRMQVMGGGTLASVKDYADAQFENLQFEIVLAPQYTMNGRLQDVNFSTNPVYGPYDNLSDDLKAKVKEIEQAMESAERGGGPGMAPPRGPRTSP